MVEKKNRSKKFLKSQISNPKKFKKKRKQKKSRFFGEKKEEEKRKKKVFFLFFSSFFKSPGEIFFSNPSPNQGLSMGIVLK